ncbi:hypothetical protein OK074_5714 [Actinobacteria bacterium OK074]|nr:hypothetical protein OK074_5714 [Actinobacteria bacterium OK074]
MATAGTTLLASIGIYLHTTLHGKLHIWRRELDRAGLKGDEQLLDLGCGRGAVLIEAARGHAHQRGCGRGRPPARDSPSHCCTPSKDAEKYTDCTNCTGCTDYAEHADKRGIAPPPREQHHHPTPNPREALATPLYSG